MSGLRPHAHTAAAVAENPRQHPTSPRHGAIIRPGPWMQTPFETGEAADAAAGSTSWMVCVVTWHSSLPTLTFGVVAVRPSNVASNV